MHSSRFALHACSKTERREQNCNSRSQHGSQVSVHGATHALSSVELSCQLLRRFESCLPATLIPECERARLSCNNATISASSAATAGDSSETESAGIAGITALCTAPDSKLSVPCESGVAEDTAPSSWWSGASGCQVLIKYTALSNCVR